MTLSETAPHYLLSHFDSRPFKIDGIRHYIPPVATVSICQQRVGNPHPSQPIRVLKLLVNTFGPRVVVTLLLLVPGIRIPAQGTFGNSPVPGTAFDFVADGGIAGGGAVAFTPLSDFPIANITVWLTGYTGLDMYGNANQSFYAGIYADQPPVDPGAGDHQPGTLLASLNVPPPNDGSPAAFDFLNTAPGLVFQADTQYWLFIYEKTSGSFNYDAYPQWVAGDAPAGAATYNGSESFWAFGFSPSSVIPAFRINAVPEPASSWLLCAGLLIGCLWRFRRSGVFRVIRPQG